MSSEKRPAALDRLVEHLFRRESGRLVARLAGTLGPEHLDLAEEAVQEAMLQALRTWPFGGVPDRPVAWLSRVARNRALDVLRRHSRFALRRDEVVSFAEARLDRMADPTFRDEIDDDQLRLIFTCCHPLLPADAGVALTLKTVCGFSVGEIARAFLAKESTIAQRLVRAKKKIAERGLPYEVPPPDQLRDRLASVHRVVYLLFNEGYSPVDGESVIRNDICEEAVRWACTLATHPITGTPESAALAALLLFQGARLPTRQDDAGEILLLADQDRTRWRRDWIDQGVAHLRAAMAAQVLSPLHLEAGIAACHAVAPSWETTDWSSILGYYDQLVELRASPVTRLNRAVAAAMVSGPRVGLAELDELAAGGELDAYYLLPAVRGELLRRCGDVESARLDLERALDLARPAPVKRFLRRKLEDLASPRPRGARGTAAWC